MGIRTGPAIQSGMEPASKWSNQFTTYFAYYELLENLVMRDVKARYKQSVLGLYWAVLNPLASALVLTVVFSFFVRVPTGSTPYVLFVLAGFLPWTFFSNSITNATASLTGNASLLTKVQFPRELLPAASVLARAVDFLFSAIVLFIFLLYFHIPLTLSLLWLPVLIIIQLIFMLGISLLLSAANLFYRDVGQLLNLIILLWMYLTPVIYPANLVPEEYYRLYMLNPMAPLVESYRRVIVEGTDPQWEYLSIAAITAVVVALASYIVFKRCEPYFAETV